MTPDFDRSARLAYKSLLAMHIESLPVDPLLILRHCRNTCVHTYAEIMVRFGASDYASFKYDCMENKDALTFRHEIGGRTVYELCYDDRGNPFRRRFTLAHELGHIVLKHRMEEEWEEKEADYFAAQLLAPAPLVALFPSDPSVIAETFQLSRKAAEMALLPPRHTDPGELYPLILGAFTAILSA